MSFHSVLNMGDEGWQIYETLQFEAGSYPYRSTH